MNFILFFFFANIGLLKDKNSCNCNEMVKSVVYEINKNYADRRSIARNTAYQKVKKNINRLPVIKSADSCALFIHDLISSFKDKHLTFRLDKDSGALVKFLYDSTGAADLYNRLIELSNNSKTIEGVWENEGKEQEYMVIKDRRKGVFNVIVWSSKHSSLKKGQLKGTIIRDGHQQYNYINYIGGKSILVVPMKIKGRSLFSLNTGYWRKVSNNNTPTVRPSLSPTLKPYSDSILVLTLPYFDPSYKKAIDSLIISNKNKISTTKYLIIDLKINYGGSTPTYQSIIPLIYTNPIRIESGLYYASEDNIATKKNFFNLRRDTGSVSWNSAKNLIERMEKNLGQHVLDTGYFIKYDTIYQNPQKVFILIGERCLSAGELFLITAKQSKKVVLFGENTYGSIDRADAVEAKLACDNIKLTVPIVLRKFEAYKRPIDKKGIPPDIVIPFDQDGVNYIIKYIKNLK